MKGEDKVIVRLSRSVATFLTQEKAAKFLGMSPQYLGDILKKRRAVPDWLGNKLGYEKQWVETRRKGTS